MCVIPCVWPTKTPAALPSFLLDRRSQICVSRPHEYWNVWAKQNMPCFPGHGLCLFSSFSAIACRAAGDLKAWPLHDIKVHVWIAYATWTKQVWSGLDSCSNGFHHDGVWFPPFVYGSHCRRVPSTGRPFRSSHSECHLDEVIITSWSDDIRTLIQEHHSVDIIPVSCQSPGGLQSAAFCCFTNLDSTAIQCSEEHPQLNSELYALYAKSTRLSSLKEVPKWLWHGHGYGNGCHLCRLNVIEEDAGLSGACRNFLTAGAPGHTEDPEVSGALGNAICHLIQVQGFMDLRHICFALDTALVHTHLLALPWLNTCFQKRYWHSHDCKEDYMAIGWHSQELNQVSDRKRQPILNQ